MTSEHTGAPSAVHGAHSAERALVTVRGVIRDHQRRVLVVRLAPDRGPAGSEYLYLPGGTVNKGESPGQAVVREVREELGLTGLPAGRLLLTAWSQARYQQLRPRLQLLFDLGRHHHDDLSDRIVLQTEEVSGYDWLDTRGVRRYLYPAQAEQLDAIAERRLYLEQQPVPRPEHVVTVAVPDSGRDGARREGPATTVDQTRH